MKKKIVWVLCAILSVFYILCFTGCSKANRNQVRCVLNEEINVLYNEEEGTSTVQIRFRFSNYANREAKSVTIACIFTDDMGNIIDEKQGNFTINLEKRTTVNSTLSFSDVQGKPTRVHITNFSPKFKENWFYSTIDWLAEYWWIIVIGVIVVVIGVSILREYIY